MSADIDRYICSEETEWDNKKALLNLAKKATKKYNDVLNFIRTLSSIKKPKDILIRLQDQDRKHLENCLDELGFISGYIETCEFNNRDKFNKLLHFLSSNYNKEWNAEELEGVIEFPKDGNVYYSNDVIPYLFQRYLYELLEQMCEIIDIGINSGLCYGAAMRYLPLSLLDASVMMKLEFGLPLSRDDTFHSEVLKKLSSLIEGVESTRKNSQDNVQISRNQDSNINELKEMLAEQKKFKANTQKDLAKWIRSGIAKYCWKNKRTVKEKVRDGFKLPNAPTLIKMLNHWNRYLASSSEKKEEMTDYEPYQKYSEILYAQENIVKEWGEYTFAPTYIKKWMARKEEKEERRRKKRKDGKKRPDALDRLKVGGDDGEVVMDDLVSKTKDADQAFYFDEPPPQKRRFRSS